jgi:hypothetical protein
MAITFLVISASWPRVRDPDRYFLLATMRAFHLRGLLNLHTRSVEL